MASARLWVPDGVSSSSCSQYPGLWPVSGGSGTPGAPPAAMPGGLGASFFRGPAPHPAALGPPGPASSSSSSGSPLYDGAPTAPDLPDSQYDTSALACLIASWTPASPPSL